MLESVFNKLQALGNFLKKETLAQVFSCEFCKTSKNTFFHGKPLVAASPIEKSFFKEFGHQGPTALLEIPPSLMLLP